MTSGNLNDRPIIIDPEEADKELDGKVDWIIHHNRPIYNRVDDSVVQFCGEQMCLLRRSRGYVPEPFFTDIDTEGIIAFGAEKTNTFALGKADTIIQSQHIGDLKNAETLAFYTESLQRFRRLFRFTPQVAVCDLHPDYLSSVVAEQFANEHFIPLIKVQHHHAHAVACMTEYAINEEVLAIVWDGTGLGDDGNSWGGEFLLCNRQKYKRLSHIDYVAMPGGDRASDEPWRMTVAYAKLYGLPLPDDFTARIGKEKIAFVSEMIDKQINTPLTSGAGRLFDAFSSLLGICDFATRQAEAAQMLEQVATDDYNSYYQILSEDDSLSVRFIFEGAIHDINGGLSTNFIAAKIHNTLAHLILEKSTELRKKTKVSKVLLSGGCFQNKRLTEHLQRLFREKNIPLFVPSQIPCNDAGVSVGQLVVAAEKLKEKIYA
jgi:hydrogenase maturation protein HypF